MENTATVCEHTVDLPEFILKNHKAIDAVIEAHCYFLAHTECAPSCMAPWNVRYAVDFGTVQVDLGRRSGKTSYINSRAGRGSLVITHSNRNAYQGLRLPVITPEQLLIAPGSLRGLHYDTVFIDEPALVFRTMKQADLYRKLLPGFKSAPKFILLGP